jgi:hypothetical protein
MVVVLCANVGMQPYDRTPGLGKTCVIFTYNPRNLMLELEKICVVFTYNPCNLMIEHLVLEKLCLVFTYNPNDFFFNVWLWAWDEKRRHSAICSHVWLWEISSTLNV